jgi:alkylated DNA repair dioxygenase AlkB
MNAPSRRRVRRSSPSAQADLFDAPTRLPEGFRYHPGVLSVEDEEALARELEQLPFKPFDFQGFLANRRVASFGYRYDYGSRAVVEAAPFPLFLDPLRRKVAAIFDRPAEAFRQVLINEYRPGAGIGWPPEGERDLGPRVGHRRAALGLSPLGAGSHDLGAQHSGPEPPSLFDHLADAPRL